MADLTEFDRDRITTDLEQLTELVERKQWLWETTTDAAKKDQIAQELAAHAETIAHLKAYLQ